MKRILSIFAALLFTAQYVLAVPAIPRPVTFTQSDGTQITIRIVGDEFRHYPVSSDGYTLAGGADGDLYYATLSTTGKLVPTSVKARPVAQLTSAERSKVSKLAKGIKPISGSKMEMSRTNLRSSFAQVQTRADGTLTPPARFSEATAIGKLKSLVILVNYKDTKFNAANGKQSFQNLLMQNGYSANGATGSAWNYYQDNSNKQFDPDFVVAGPYTLSKTSSYYAGSDGTDNVPEMIVDAAKMADADINFAEYADNGVIRNVFVFFAGKNQAETGITTTVWPHQWDVRAGGYYVQLDGQLLAGYACSSELNGRSQFAGIGTFCHEFGHVLGWPDFYDTDYDESGGEAVAMENYSLMCSGSYNNDGRTPPAVNMLERWMMGWATPEDISTGGGSRTLDPVWKDKGYIVRTPTTNDYFILEGRAMGSFKWDNYIEDSYGRVNADAKGLFVYHIDYTKPSQWQNNTLNNNPNRECTKIIRSVPGTSSAGKPLNTFFPGTKNVTTLSSTSNTGFKSWLNVAPLTSFTSIAISGEQIILVSPGGQTPDPVFNVTETTINSNDALLKWSYSVAAASWQVTWKTNGQQVGTKTVTEAQILIEGLAPSTKYDVTFKTGDKEYSYSFTTKAKVEADSPLINFPANIETGKPVSLSIGAASGTVTSTEWVVDGQKIAGSQTTFTTAGEHKLMATLTLNDGTKQHIIKFITVK